ncbi:MAG: YqgE/AlgH family protein [Chitinophagaceae bacterium]
MKLHEGCIIESNNLLKNDYFSKSKIFIIQHNHNGSIGFVINKQSRKHFIVGNKKFFMYNGGPVKTNDYNLLHTAPLEIAGSIHILHGIYWKNNITGDNTELLNTSIQNIKIFKGYCGWDAKELEKEVKDGYWDVLEASAQQVLNS